MPTEDSPADGQSNKIPLRVFTTDQADAPDRFDAWRESIGVLFDVEPRERKPPPEFSASLRIYNLGQMLVTGTSFGAQRFSRDTRKISSDGLDHYQVQLYYGGSLVGATKRTEMKVRPGDIQIVDFAQPHTSVVHDSSTIVLMVGRELLSTMLPARADLHGAVLPGDRGTGGLLADYMRALYSRMESMNAAEMPYVERATAHMIAACLHPTTYATARARGQIEGVIADRIKGYIDQNLDKSELTPDALCRRFRISRTQLYRVFEPLGGVAAYIRTRRLDRAFADLRDPLLQHRKIFEIAFRLGFSSIANFNSAFRRQFGMSPSDLRATPRSVRAIEQKPSTRTNSEDYQEWVRRLGRPSASD